MEILKVNESITVTFTDLDIKYIRVLLSQSGHKEELEKTISELDPELCKTIIEARGIYMNLYRSEFVEEKELQPKLVDIFKLIVKYKK